MFLFVVLSSAAQQQTYVRHDMGYVEVTDSVHTIRSAFIGFTVIAVVQRSPNAVVQYQTPTSKGLQNIINTVKLQPGSTVVVNATKGYAKIAYLAVDENKCHSGLSVTTQHSFVFDPSVSQNSEFCLLYAPATPNLRFNVLKATMDDRFDSLTIFHEKVNDIWYDRYETIENPSGWSAISERPWFLKFSVVRYKGNENSASVVVHLNSTEMKVENELIYTEVPQLVASSALEIVTSHEILIPIIGCVTPTLLLLSWVYAFWRLNRKRPIEEVVDESM